MKAIKSEKLLGITDTPENREKFRKFLVTRSSTTNQFVMKNGTNIIVEFVVGESPVTK